ncbi:MAG: hypothetical protein HOM68_08155 [Gemmatimonadetes bacterium]|nr:hypothetical protein [Gemmatimonadota bacterium]MBT5056499.1 hypothetical protein [Gemmatimonadota bacterium]MBT5142485.1 hypothetical protein [Gemmatimonadota bacterium]MBT5586415.1 hypothetical protein [Gemmatimonadota bacterium]MBT5961218.1 hypothetical protein [Gemmatimonadota bacterium]
MTQAGQKDPLVPRLFGFATLFRAQVGPTGIQPVDSDAAVEADALARAIADHVGVSFDASVQAESVGAEPLEGGLEWGVSVPFGRCGVHGRPHEHVRIYGADQAWCDRIAADGSQTTVSVEEGEDLTFLPGHVQRIRALPREKGRVLVAFQTEDRTPLAGHAVAWMGDEAESVPDDPAQRVLLTHRAFNKLAASEPAQIQQQVTAFMRQMSDLVQNESIEAEHRTAKAAGSYQAGADDALFERQRCLVNSSVLAQIAARDAARFRYPGMFGAVAPMYDLVAD